MRHVTRHDWRSDCCCRGVGRLCGWYNGLCTYSAERPCVGGHRVRNDPKSPDPCSHSTPIRDGLCTSTIAKNRSCEGPLATGLGPLRSGHQVCLSELSGSSGRERDSTLYSCRLSSEAPLPRSLPGLFYGPLPMRFPSVFEWRLAAKYQAISILHWLNTL